MCTEGVILPFEGSGGAEILTELGPLTSIKRTQFELLYDLNLSKPIRVDKVGTELK